MNLSRRVGDSPESVAGQQTLITAQTWQRYQLLLKVALSYQFKIDDPNAS
jgi:hypothetical protein